MRDDVPTDGVRLIPLGGLGDIGRNMMVVETADDLVVVDAGIMFPPEELLGVDFIIPDVSYLRQRAAKLRAYLVTHGHEDHIGALPYLLPELPAPIYATRLAQGLLGLKLKEAGLDSAVRVTIDEQSTSELGSIQAEYFPVAHSIPDAVGIALRTPAGLLVHTGDFKIDHTPVLSSPTDLPRLAAYGSEGVRVLMSDSTYADHPGHTPSEQVVGDALQQIMFSTPGRVIIATFASQIARLQQIIDGAEAAGRTVFVTGRSMVNNVRMARDLGYVTIAHGGIRHINEHDGFPDDEVVIVCTGAQGEPMSALARMATGDHREVMIKAGDTVVLSSSPIPGNEAAVNRTIDNIFRQGAVVRSVGSGDPNVHVRGHAAQEELKTVLNLTRPELFVPVHGAFRHLAMHVDLAQSLGVPQENCHLLLDGDVLELTNEAHAVVDTVPASYVSVDGLSVGGVDHTVLRDRQHLATEGMVVVVVPVDHRTGQIAGQIDVVFRGFAVSQDSEALRKRAVEQVRETLLGKDHPVEWTVVQELLKSSMSQFLYRETRQRPMMLPVVVEV